MYKPIHLEAKNFQSFESLSYDFRVGKAILIEGDNRTDDGQKTNGSGKSSFGEIIYYLLLGTSSTGKRDIKLVRWGCKSAYISIVLENQYLKHTLKIERTLYANSKPSALEISINGESQRNRYASVSDGNKLILDLIGISAEDIKNYYLVNRNRFISFFDSPDSSKRGLLARFSGIDVLSQVDQGFDRTISELEVKSNGIEKSLIATESKIDILKETLADKKADNYYEKEVLRLKGEIDSYQSRIESNKSQMSLIEPEIAKAEKERVEAENKVAELNRKISDMQSVDFDGELENVSRQRTKLIEQIDALTREKSDITSESSELEKELAPIVAKLNGAVTCPKCKTEFVIADKDFDVTDAKSIVDETTEYLKELYANITKKDVEIQVIKNSNQMRDLEAKRLDILNRKSEYSNRISQIRKYEIEPLLSQISRCQRDIESYNTRKIRLSAERMSLENSINTKESEIRSLSKDIVNPEIGELEMRIGKFEDELKNLRSQRSEIDDDIQIQKTWKERFSQFYVHITNKTLEVIENHCNLFLKDIKSDLEIRLEGFRILANKSIKEAVTASISRNGFEPEDFKCFSGGERGRAVFSTILTFQQMINEMSHSGGLDLLMIDEVLDQVDAEGMGLFIDSLEPLNRTIFIVSQVKTTAPVENTMIIAKVNGISEIVE